MGHGMGEERVMSTMGCEYKGCDNESDYYCTDIHRYMCHEHIYLDEEED